MSRNGVPGPGQKFTPNPTLPESGRLTLVAEKHTQRLKRRRSASQFLWKTDLTARAAAIMIEAAALLKLRVELERRGITAEEDLMPDDMQGSG